MQITWDADRLLYNPSEQSYYKTLDFFCVDTSQVEISGYKTVNRLMGLSLNLVITSHILLWIIDLDGI